jgi:hypothetical protein
LILRNAPGIRLAVAGEARLARMAAAAAILFCSAAYFTGRLYGTMGLIVCGVGFLTTVGVLYVLGGIGFG